MNAYNYIVSKQIEWAYNNDINLIGSQIERGRPAYTSSVSKNLFQPLTSESKRDFLKGDGNELKAVSNLPVKMQAVHSSSALAVNIFQYWNIVEQVPDIARACGLCNRNNSKSRTIRFEQHFEITQEFKLSPNIDVVIHNEESSAQKVFAIESKFSEAYSSRKHECMSEKYIANKALWDDLPNLYKFAKTISSPDNQFDVLHPAQLIKHILGLKNNLGKNGFRLLYMWYDCLGREGMLHQEEVDRFAVVAKADGIKFSALTYQELIIRIASEYRENHPEYVKYISERYL